MANDVLYDRIDDLRADLTEVRVELRALTARLDRLLLLALVGAFIALVATLLVKL